MAKVCGKFGCEIGISVQDDFAGNTIVWCHISGIEAATPSESMVL
jgi:hypothetical protein